MNQPAPPRPLRSCGGCTLCCKALAIKELGKPTGVACQHICSAGCAVQDQRPHDPIYYGCNTYNCLWLLGDLEESDRPDKLRAVFTAMPHPNPEVRLPLVLVNEAFPGSSESGRPRQIIDDLARRGHSIVVKNPQYSTEHYPNGTVVRFRIDPADPLKMRYDQAAKPIPLRVGGKPVA